MLTLNLKNGQKITANGSLGDNEEFLEKVNNQAIISITVGNIPVNKSAVRYISQSQPEGISPNVTIYFMDGSTVEAYDEDFNASEYSSKINNQQNLFSLLGDVIVNKFDYMMAIEDTPTT